MEIGDAEEPGGGGLVGAVDAHAGINAQKEGPE